MSSKSRSANKTGLLIQDVFKLRDFDEIKNKLIEKYGKYLYLLSFHEKSYINIVYNSLITYKIDENVRLNEDKNYKYYYQAGLIGKNIFFTKLEDTTDLIPLHTDCKVDFQPFAVELITPFIALNTVCITFLTPFT